MRGGTLYLVATPIGNLGDVSRRCLEVLGQVDLIASESPPAAKRLLSALGLRGRVVPFREANREQAARDLVARLQNGQSVALLSEAGMPAISDPGWTLVRACHEHGLSVTCVPGASALTVAVALSGLPSRRLAFEGFLPRKGGERRQAIEQLRSEPRTIVLFEAPHRIRETLTDLLAALGDREAFLGREFTKQFETLRLGRLSTLLQDLDEPRGEYVLVLGPADTEGETPELDPDWVDFLREQGLSTRQMAAILARQTGLPRRQLYQQLLGE